MYVLGLGATLWRCSPSMYVRMWCVVILCYAGLKCQLSGDAPQSSWSSINDVHYSGSVCWLSKSYIRYSWYLYRVNTALQLQQYLLLPQLISSSPIWANCTAGGYEIARADDFWHTRASYVGFVKHRQPVLFHSHPGQMGEHEHPKIIILSLAPKSSFTTLT